MKSVAKVFGIRIAVFSKPKTSNNSVGQMEASRRYIGTTCYRPYFGALPLPGTEPKYRERNTKPGEKQ